MNQEQLQNIFGELTKLPNIQYHHIESENPEHHWHLLPVNNEVVLDLGCGFHLIENGWMSTPEYFLNKGASKIIGVDLETGDIAHFNKNLPNNIFFADRINTVEKIDYYINNFGITSLKMDIEGDEICFINSLSDYPTLKHVAIETHNRELMKQMVNKLLSLNFKINTLCSFYPRVFDICNLIYASRE